ncbi:MAG: spore maturation protein [Cyclobacteriaceae bacterium]|nr:spore maturation protein [Cyclobacteriaceae bacterium]
MVLNYIWIAFFLIAFIIGLVRLVFFGDVEIFPALFNSTLDMAKTGFNISLGLTGAMTLWLGIMKIGENGGIVNVFYKLTGPLLRRLFPGLPADSKAFGPMIMNVSANMMGLDNAATPLGLKAMEEMQVHNKEKDTASDAQIMFLVLNTSGLTILPINVMVIRTQMGAADPSDIFIPTLLATFFATLAGIIIVSIYQRINLFNKVIVGYLGSLTLIVAGIIWYFSQLPKEQISTISSVASNLTLFSVIIIFILMALIKKVNVYESFIEGAKEGFSIAIKIIPFLVAMLVAIGVFRTSGALDYLIGGIKWLVNTSGANADFVDALPTAFMRPLSGSGARGMMIETINTFGVDSFAGRLSSVMQGTTETTLYVIAVYFGAVSIRKTRYAITAGLFADLVGIISAIFISYMFFH